MAIPITQNKNLFLTSLLRLLFFSLLLAVYFVFILKQFQESNSFYLLLYLFFLGTLFVYTFLIALVALKVNKISSLISYEEDIDNLKMAKNKEVKQKIKEIDENLISNLSLNAVMLKIDPLIIIIEFIFFTAKSLLFVLKKQKEISKEDAYTWHIFFVTRLWLLHPHTRQALYIFSLTLLLLIAESCGIDLSYLKILPYLLSAYGLFKAIQAWKNIEQEIALN